MNLYQITRPLRLAKGSHQRGSGKGCAMNVISYINGHGGARRVGIGGMAVLAVMALGADPVANANPTDFFAAAQAAGVTVLADGSDDQFLSALAAAGIPAHDGIPAVIAHGRNVCDALGAGMSPGEAANELAHYAYAEDPSHPFDQYLRTMQAFVRVSTQTFCAGRAGAAYHHGGRVILAGLNVPSPPPQLPEVPDVIHFAAPPVQVAPRPKQTPPPVQKPPPPPPEVVPPPSEGSQGGQGKGGTGGGIDGGGTSSGGTQSAPDPSEGRIALLP
jgi:uncharacterized membrane protein YgcG